MQDIDVTLNYRKPYKTTVLHGNETGSLKPQKTNSRNDPQTWASFSISDSWIPLCLFAWGEKNTFVRGEETGQEMWRGKKREVKITCSRTTRSLLKWPEVSPQMSSSRSSSYSEWLKHTSKLYLYWEKSQLRQVIHLYVCVTLSVRSHNLPHLVWGSGCKDLHQHLLVRPCPLEAKNGKCHILHILHSSHWYLCMCVCFLQFLP